MKKTKQQHPLAAVNSMPGPAIKANGQRKQSDSKQSALWIHATETSQWWQSMTTSSKPCLLGEGITAIQHACVLHDCTVLLIRKQEEIRASPRKREVAGKSGKEMKRVCESGGRVRRMERERERE
eukprot:scpid93230/ scgid2801/ 